MPSTRRHSYDLNFKLKIVVEAEAVNNNHEIAREYGISQENAGFCIQKATDSTPYSPFTFVQNIGSWSV